MDVEIPKLNSYAYYLCKNWHDAEDITSAAIIKGFEFAQRNDVNITNANAYFSKFIKWEFLLTLRKKQTVSLDGNDFLMRSEPEQEARLTCRGIIEKAATLNFKKRSVIHDFLKGYPKALIFRRNRHITENSINKYIREFKHEVML